MVMMRPVPDSRGATTPGARRSRRAVALLLGAVVWSGCSGGEEGVTDLSLGGQPPASLVEQTDTAPAINSSVTTTAAPTTALSSTTDAPTPPPGPETSLAPDETDAVVAAYLAAWRAYKDALRSPSDEGRVEVIRRTRTGPSLERALSNVELYRSRGYESRPSAHIEDRATVETAPMPLGNGRYALTVCETDASVVVEPGAAPDGSDALVNDEVVARRIEVVVVASSTGYLLENGTLLQEWNGASECAAP
jgi:hypothetical protein